jgi:CSLREA domain-containing protein
VIEMMKSGVARSVLWAACWVCLSAVTGWTVELRVNSTEDRPGTAPGDGRCTTGTVLPDGTHECTLRAAIEEANARRGTDTIVVPSGNYVLTYSTMTADEEDRLQRLGSLDVRLAVLTGDLDIGTELGVLIDDPLIIRGEGDTPPVIDGNGADRVFDIHGRGDVLLSNLVIQNGHSNNGGAGVRIYVNGAVRLVDLVVQQNQAEPRFALGGGLWVTSGFVTLERCVVRDNSAAGGGGIFNSSPLGRLEIFESTITNNTAHSTQHIYDGGGLGMHSGYGVAVARIGNSTFSNNTAALHGGGMAIVGAASFVNVTISGNRAGGLGGGVFVGLVPSPPPGTEVVAMYSTIADNSGLGGGGLANVGNRLFLESTIVSGNRSNSGGPSNCHLGGVESRGYNVDSGYDCRLTHATDLTSTNPLLGPLADNGGAVMTHALLTGSPAIDTGRPTTSMRPYDSAAYPMDARGILRPQGRATDRGAYEAALLGSGFFPIRFPLALSFRFFVTAFSLPVALEGDPLARIVDVKPGPGVDDVKLTLAKDGRSVLVEAVLGQPLPVGVMGNRKARPPILCSLVVQKSLRTPLALRLGEGQFATQLKTPGKLLPAGTGRSLAAEGGRTNKLDSIDEDLNATAAVIDSDGP